MTSSRHSLTASDDVFAHVVAQTVADGPGSGTRVLAVAPAGGLHARVLVDRGFDIGAAWFRGEPVAWLSGAGEHPSGSADAGEGWHDGWSGGLVTTCGLQNVGLPSEGHGRHGRFSGLGARDVAVTRNLDETGRGRIELTATIHEPVGLGRGIEVNRRISFDVGSGTVELEDIATNRSAERLEAPLLYHVNLGHPFLDAETRLCELRDERFVPAPDSRPMGAPVVVPDTVTEHLPVVGADGTASVSMLSATLGMQLTVTWDATTLPRLFSWQRRTPGSYVAAIEPANCGVQGRAADRSEGRSPSLEPEEQRRTWLRLSYSSAPGPDPASALRHETTGTSALR